MMVKQIIISQDTKTRIDKYLSEEVNLSRSYIQELIAKGHILVNDNNIKPSYKPVIGDEIIITEPKEKPIEAEDLELEILYEDNEILVINKPQGLLVHPTDHQKTGTLVNGLLGYTENLGNKDSIRPGIVHRLDRDTSGVMVIAKTDKSYNNLVKLFSTGKVKRYYYAILEGHLKEKILVDKPIGRDPHTRIKMTVIDTGRASQTILEPIELIDNYSLVRAELLTGRTHQIRVHTSYLGMPVIGDMTYGHPNHYGYKEMMLHAYKLEFNHPITNKNIKIKTELPDRMKDLKQKLERLP